MYNLNCEKMEDIRGVNIDMRHYRNKIARELKSYRVMESLNQAQLADKLGVPLKTISRIETENNEISKNKLNEVYKKFLEVSESSKKISLRDTIQEELESIEIEKELLDVKAKLLKLEDIKLKVDKYSQELDTESRAFVFIDELYERASNIGYEEGICGELGCVEGHEYENKTLVGKVSKTDIKVFEDDSYIEIAFMIRVVSDYYVCRATNIGECYISRYSSFDRAINSIVDLMNSEDSTYNHTVEELNNIIAKFKIELS